METILKVEGMQCGHCKKAVEEGISKLEGVTSVVVDLENKTVKVMHSEEVSIETLTSEIIDLGYEII